MVVPPTLHRVILLTSDDVHRARPAYTPIAPGDQVKFVNLIDAPVVLRFPHGLFDQDVLQLSFRSKVILTAQSPDDGRYPYSGDVNSQTDVLKGESNPEMIIDR